MASRGPRLRHRERGKRLDITQIYLDAIPLVFAFVLGLSFLLLVVFHSLVIPIKAILLNLLSTAAAFGVMMAVFQDGILGHAFGLAPFERHRELGADLRVRDPVRSLDGLPRVHPDPGQGGPRPRARLPGGGRPGHLDHPGTITSAATIMVVVFAGLRDDPVRLHPALGLGLAVAVLLDATVVRSVLLPATMTLLGDWNWWLPSFLRWLPRVTITAGMLATFTVPLKRRPGRGVSGLTGRPRRGSITRRARGPIAASPRLRWSESGGLSPRQPDSARAPGAGIGRRVPGTFLPIAAKPGSCA